MMSLTIVLFADSLEALSFLRHKLDKELFFAKLKLIGIEWFGALKSCKSFITNELLDGWKKALKNIVKIILTIVR